ncbi:MAG TPA: adenylate/guanylate cyclase domain-containing protein [Candidatus Cloacimonadota bacterium]|nr:adenylate/guanylate cyclase domain-containing protein [Candidatus Cloacimonadota bacterium]
MSIKGIFILLFALVALVVTSAFFYTSYGEHLESKVYDLFLKQKSKQNPISNDIIIVSVDDETFQAFDIQWPFPREYHAHLIRNLKKLGAKQIIFDIEFAESYKKHIDSDLGLAAKEHGNVIFAGKIYQSVQNNYLMTTILPPVAEIRNHNQQWGIVNMPGDSDGFVRKYNLYHQVNQQTFYSLALKSFMNLHKTNIERHKNILIVGDLKIPIVQQNEVLINYYGTPKYFKHISYSSVIDDSSFHLPIEEFFEINDFYHLQKTRVFQDKIVLIGATVDELKDNFHTPVNPKNHLMAGVEIHANMLQMLLDKHFIKKVSFTWYLFYSGIILILLSNLFYKLKPHISLIFSLLIIFLYVLISFQLFSKMNIFIPILVLPVMILILYFCYLIYHYLMENKEKKAIKKTFQHYMAPALVKELLKSPDKLKYGGSQTEITVLFSDIRSFTTYTESHDVEDTVSMLREYLTEMVNTIINNQGILDKFVGDEVMALFNTPVPIENHALKACYCAMEMIDRLRLLQDKWRSEGREIINIGIGINTGMAVVGNLGSEQIFDYTAIGDTVNLGARLEALNKNYNTKNHIIISEFTLEKVKDYIEYEYLDEVIVKGKTKAIKIYQLLSINDYVYLYQEKDKK